MPHVAHSTGTVFFKKTNQFLKIEWESRLKKIESSNNYYFFLKRKNDVFLIRVHYFSNLPSANMP